MPNHFFPFKLAALSLAAPCAWRIEETGGGACHPGAMR